MILKEHEQSRLLRHKDAIDQYRSQISSYKWELESPSITDDTKSEIESNLIDVNSAMTSETLKLKIFTEDLMARNSISSFDKFADMILAGLAEVEKILDRLPEDIRRPFDAIIDKLKSVIEFLKSVF